MIGDAHELADGTELRADVCIVGSGPAGLTIALELEGSGLDVLVLEGGGMEFEDDSQALYEVEMTGEQFGAEGDPMAVTTTRLRQFGGTSQHWSGYCRPLRRVDLEARPALGRPGWPITYDDLVTNYDRALELLQIGPFRFDHGYWADQADIGAALVDDDTVETFVYQVSPVQFGTTYRDAAANGSMRLIHHASVTGIVPAESGRTVERLDAATLTGKSFTVVAGRYIIATGGIETPRLLLASARDRGGLGNGSDQVGRGFCEHGQNTLAVGAFATDVAGLSAYEYQDVPSPLGRGPDGMVSIQGALLLSDDTLRREDLLGVEAQLYPLDWTEASPDAASGPTLDQAGDLLAAFDGVRPASKVGFLITAEQSRHPDSRITLTDRTDALGMPRAELHWLISEDDRRSIVRGVEIMADRLGAVGAGRIQVAPGAFKASGGSGLLGRFRVDPAAIDPANFHMGHANHHCCTVPMSANASSGVCDSDQKVWGFEDLYLAGSGVFPTAGVTSPTISIVALSVRLAAHLRATT